MDWVKGFIIPIIEIVFIGGILMYIGFYVWKAFHNATGKAWKYTWKYKVLKKPYPEKTIKWVLECMDKGIGWYDAKKILMVGMVEQEKINETMWIYDEIISEYSNQKYQKGGIKDHGRKFKRSYSKDETTGELPITEIPKF